MRIIEKMKRGIQSWLEIQPADPLQLSLKETLNYQGNAIKNRIWYEGDGNQLQQLYEHMSTGIDKYKFWASKSSPGIEMRKIHTGLPGIMVDTLASVVLADIKDFNFEDQTDAEIWEKIDQENSFMKNLEGAVKQTLYIGDGVFKISGDSEISEYPILEFYPGDRVELVHKRGRLREIIFKTIYEHNKKVYVLHEHYGYGYIKNKLYYDDKELPFDAIPQTRGLNDVTFSTYAEDENGVVTEAGKYMLAVPFKFYKSSKWEGRGQSIFDKKTDNFDSLDETWSQWMDALRVGRSREYIPEKFIPRNPETGELLRPNAFDNRFMKIEDDVSEAGNNRITVEQPNIPHESYASTYATALDQCLQGILSPSTLGVDIKKLDNAEAQREKEKVTLYTRNTIVGALEEELPKIVQTAVRAYKELQQDGTAAPFEDIKASIDFGEYANPSFESQVETIGKARQNRIISVEASVDELYGDSKDKDWKAEEVKRLKEEAGITTIEEPAVNLEGVKIIE